MNNAHTKGDTIQITGVATSGTPLIVGTCLAIPVKSLASGEAGAALIEGVFTLKKLSSAVITQGAMVHWDESAGEVIITSTATGDLENFGVAVAAAGNGATSVAVKLLPGRGAVKAGGG